MISLLQVGRAVAALLVVAFHASLATEAYTGSTAFEPLGFGWAGVQFFFVLSGFIIFRVHRSDIGKRESLHRYAFNRAARIYPLYLLVTLVLLPVWILAPTEPYHDDMASILASLLLVPQAHHPHLTVGWTLTHELLFYLLFALAIVDRRLLGVLVCWFAAVAAAAISGTALPFPLSFLLSINNLLFGFGMLAAWLVERRRFGGGTLLAGVVIFIAACYANASGKLLDDSRVLIIALGVGALLITLSSLAPNIERVSRRPMLLFLGEASYSIYLAHFPAISVACKLLAEVGGVSSGMTFGIAATAGVASGLALHLGIERPLQAALRRRRSIDVLALPRAAPADRTDVSPS